MAPTMLRLFSVALAQDAAFAASPIATPIAASLAATPQGPSTRAPVLREEAPAPQGVAGAQQGTPAVDVEPQNAASAAPQAAPAPPVFYIPPMDWLLSGPAAPFLGENDDFVAAHAPPPPPPPYCSRHGFDPCPPYTATSRLPSLTPSDELEEHFAPAGYGPVPEFSSPPAVIPVDELPPGLAINLPLEVKTVKIDDAAPTLTLPMMFPDLNLPAPEVKEEENQDAAPPFALPTPSPEAHVLLRRFASAMAARPAGIRAGTWSPEALGLTGRVAELRLNEAAPHLPSSSAEGPSCR